MNEMKSNRTLKMNRERGKASLAILVLLMLLVLPLAASMATAETKVESTVVILVSDEASDSALAKLVESWFAERGQNVKIVTTPWSVYSEDVLEQIEDLNPAKVIIIGGPVAVPEEYETQLENLGIDVERIWGKDRFETAFKVYKRFRLHLRKALRGAVIVNGFDDQEIEKVLEEKGAAVIILPVPPSDVPSYVQDILEEAREAGARVRIEIRASPDMNVTRIRAVIVKRGFLANIVKANLSGRAEKMIEIAREELEKAMEAESEAGNISEGRLVAAHALIERANKLLEKAEEAYEDGKYGRAFGLANAAYRLSKNAERILEGSGATDEIIDVAGLRARYLELRKELRERMRERIREELEKFRERMRERMRLGEELEIEKRVEVEREGNETEIESRIEIETGRRG